MATDTRYARCTGIGTGYLGSINTTAQHALDMIEQSDFSDAPIFAVEYIKQSLQTIMRDSQMGKDKIEEIMAEPNPERIYGEDV